MFINLCSFCHTNPLKYLYDLEQPFRLSPFSSSTISCEVQVHAKGHMNMGVNIVFHTEMIFNLCFCLRNKERLTLYFQKVYLVLNCVLNIFIGKNI